MNRLLFLLITCVLLGGCGLNITKAKPEEQHTPTIKPVETDDKPSSASFTKETLSELLVAEFAERRGYYDISLHNYLSQAKQTKDPLVIERTYQIASFLNASDELPEIAILWVKQSPDNSNALQAAAIELAKQGKNEQAAIYLEQLLQQHNNANLGFMIDATSRLSVQSRDNLISILKKLTHNHPEHVQLTYLISQIYEQNGQYEQALSTLQAIPEPKQTIAIKLIQVDLLKNLGQPEQAITLLKRQAENNPDDKNLQLTYARLLVSLDRFTDAKQQFSLLLEKYPEDEEIRFSLALVSLEKKQWDDAILYLNQIINNGITTDAIYYYLGTAYFEKGQMQLAVEAFSQIKSGEFFLAAKAQSVKILTATNEIDSIMQLLAKARQEQPEYATALYLLEIEVLTNSEKLPQAWQLSNRALEQSPDNISLLYSRSLIADKMHNIKLAEQDLRTIIRIEPQNANAINALGYILANKTTRYKEALKLIEQAHSIDPDNPAILDSLGWINFRLGQLDMAYKYVKLAYNKYPDPEVAAHLGEILWAKGKQQEAKQIWTKSLKNAPDNQILNHTILRLTGSKEL